MRHTPQAGFDPTQDNRHGGFEIAPDDICIYHAGTIRAAVVNPTRRVIVTFPLLFQRSVVGNHGIHTPCCHPPKQARFTQAADILIRAWIGLSDHPHPVTSLEQQLADHRNAHKGAVDVTVAGYQDHIQPIPTQAY